MPKPKKTVEWFNGRSGYQFLSHGPNVSDQRAGDNVQMMWQFRISVYPEQENLIKAFQALQAYCERLDGSIGCKLISLGEDNDLQKIDATRTDAGDREQRGKEICVYMPYDDQKNSFVYTPENYKTVMLTMWQLLEHAKVRLSYLEPARDEKVPSSDPGVLTPFQYSSNKPWQKPEGILHETNYNPRDFPDPLEGVHISKRDLNKMGILRYGATLIRQERIQYMTEHFEQRIRSIDGEIKTWASDKTPSPFLEAMNTIRKLLALDTLEGANIATFKDCVNYLNSRDSRLPTDFYNGSRRSFSEQEIAGWANNFNNAREQTVIESWSAVKEDLRTLLREVDQAIEKTHEQLSTHPLCPHLPTGWQDAVARFPYEMQSVDKQLTHLLHEQERIVHAQSLLTKSTIQDTLPQSYRSLTGEQKETLAQIRALLDDYTKSGSALKRAFTGHWNRHHVDEVQAIVGKIDNGHYSNVQSLIQDLAAIKPNNPEGSLARRIAFIKTLDNAPAPVADTATSSTAASTDGVDDRPPKRP